MVKRYYSYKKLHLKSCKSCFNHNIMRKEHETFLTPRGALCRSVPHGYVAYRLFEVSAREVSFRSAWPKKPIRLLGYPAFRPPGFPPFGFSAYRLYGLSAFRLFRNGDGKCCRLARPFSSDLKPCLTMGKPEVKLTFNWYRPATLWRATSCARIGLCVR